METIKSSEEITRLFKQGRRVSTPELSLIVLRNEGQHDQQGRVAFIAGKKNGNAVWRNSAKRRMREVCRELGGPFPGFDVAFVAKRRVTDERYEVVVNNARSRITEVTSRS